VREELLATLEWCDLDGYGIEPVECGTSGPLLPVGVIVGLVQELCVCVGLWVSVSTIVLLVVSVTVKHVVEPDSVIV
jgi:hypothetical protein